MSFIGEIAAALDQEDVESRVVEGALCVPITADVEVQFVAIDSPIPAAQVYITAADVADDELDDGADVLVSIVFTVDDAVATVKQHIATDVLVTIVRDLIDGNDERIADAEFTQDLSEPNMVWAEVASQSEIQVQVDVEDAEIKASVLFISREEVDEELVDETIEELWDESTELSDIERDRIFQAVLADMEAMSEEILELGTFTTQDMLFDVLSVAISQAEQWESELTPVLDGQFEYVPNDGSGGGYTYDDDLDDDDVDEDDLDDDLDDD